MHVSDWLCVCVCVCVYVCGCMHGHLGKVCLMGKEGLQTTERVLVKVSVCVRKCVGEGMCVCVQVCVFLCVPVE